MKYPDISHYYETMLHPQGRFGTLEKFIPVRDRHGDLDYTAGNHSVVFPVKVGEQTYALKYYTHENTQRSIHYRKIGEYLQKNPAEYWVGFRYLEDEATVFDSFGGAGRYPVLLMDHVDGKSLGRHVRERCHNGDRKALDALARSFDRMALWMARGDFAHGDVKPDNILVTPDGRLKLIDYDGMFVPALAGQSAPELGTRAFQHPARERSFFDARIDDYPLALLGVSLHALAGDPGLYARWSDGESLIFSPEELLAGDHPLWNELRKKWLAEGRDTLYALAGRLTSKNPVSESLAEILQLLVSQSEGSNNMQPEPLPLETLYDESQPFSEGWAAVKRGDRWFYIDGNGRVAIDASAYDEVQPFREGRARVRTDNSFGYIDHKGRPVIPARYKEALPFSEGLAGARETGKFGFLNTAGNWAIPACYDSVSSFREGVCVVQIDEKYRYIDREGRWLTPDTFDLALGFRGGRAVAERGGLRFTLVKNDKNDITYDPE
ncbi:MAG: WG repeat-containing protein [Rikenellaceae bacterium]|nr:WG repeat-containing protein [Rikenellaceae bacterium]